jgi:DNA-binding sugar fermentation-stimulating protein
MRKLAQIGINAGAQMFDTIIDQFGVFIMKKRDFGPINNAFEYLLCLCMDKGALNDAIFSKSNVVTSQSKNETFGKEYSFLYKIRSQTRH